MVSGLQQLRKDVFDTLDYDTVVVLDSHWATTVEFVITAQKRRAGLFTSQEPPRGMSITAVSGLGTSLQQVVTAQTAALTTPISGRSRFFAWSRRSGETCRAAPRRR